MDATYLNQVFSAYQKKVYFSGILAKKNVTAADGSPYKMRSWIRWYVELQGPSLVFWSLSDSKLEPHQQEVASLIGGLYPRNSQDFLSTIETIKSIIQKPNFINISDSSCKIIGQLRKRSSVWDLNSSGANHFYFQASDDFEMNAWVLAIRLSSFDFILINELYTSNQINNLYSFPSAIHEFKCHIQFRIAGSEKWFDAVLDVSKSSISSKPDLKIWFDNTSDTNLNYPTIVIRITDIQNAFSIYQPVNTNQSFISRVFGNCIIDYSLLPPFAEQPSQRDPLDNVSIKFVSQPDLYSSILSISNLFSLYGIPSKFIPKFIPTLDNISFPLSKVQNTGIEQAGPASSRLHFLKTAMSLNQSNSLPTDALSGSPSPIQNSRSKNVGKPLSNNSAKIVSSTNSSISQSESSKKSKKFSLFSAFGLSKKKKNSSSLPPSTNNSSGTSISQLNPEKSKISPPIPKYSQNSVPSHILNNQKLTPNSFSNFDKNTESFSETFSDNLKQITDRASKINFTDSYIDSSGEITHVGSMKNNFTPSQPNSSFNQTSTNFSLQISDSESDEPISSLIDSKNNSLSKGINKKDSMLNLKNNASNFQESVSDNSFGANDNFNLTPRLAAAAAQVSINDLNNPNYSQNNQNLPQNYQDQFNQQNFNNNIPFDTNNPYNTFPQDNFNMYQDNQMQRQSVYFDPNFPINQAQNYYNQQYFPQNNMNFGYMNNNLDFSEGPLISFEQKASPIEKATGLVGAIANREQIKSEQKYRDSGSIIKDRKMRRYAASAMGNYVIPNQNAQNYTNTLAYDDDDIPISMGRVMSYNNFNSQDQFPNYNNQPLNRNTLTARSTVNFNDFNAYNNFNNSSPVNQSFGLPPPNQFNNAINRRSVVFNNQTGPSFVDNNAFIKNSNMGYAHTVSNLSPHDNYENDDLPIPGFTNNQRRSSVFLNNQQQRVSTVNLRNSQYIPNFQNTSSINPQQFINHYASNPPAPNEYFDRANRNSASFPNLFNNQAFNAYNGSYNPRNSSYLRNDSVSTKSSDSMSNNSSYSPAKAETSKFDPRSSNSRDSAVINSGRFEKKTLSTQSSTINSNSRFSTISDSKNIQPKIKGHKLALSTLKNNSFNNSDFDDSNLTNGKSKRNSKKPSVKLEFEYDSSIPQKTAVTFEKFLQKCVDSKPYGWVIQHDAYSSYLNFCTRNGIAKNDRVSLDIFLKMMSFADWKTKVNKNGENSFYNMVLI
ncbi:hypothetical protein AYI69_g3882 [Smittium culicis]|uniref:PH domain-containing protein n=1 Tax=Smittium culicis TaxID=133412 RepID=A0A1R1YIT6_9FUNG|nr:hypothetical protein AYI69_g3882 [Smittium culicis]